MAVVLNENYEAVNLMLDDLPFYPLPGSVLGRLQLPDLSVVERTSNVGSL